MSEQKGDFKSERLLMLSALGERHGSYGHIYVRVVRRAIPHVVGEDGKVVHYNDERFATGYRNTAWSSGTQRAIYVDSLRLNGQFDISAAHKREGVVYQPRLEFDPLRVDATNCLHMAATFRAWERFRNSVAHTRVVRDDALYEMREQLQLLQGFLGISKFLVTPEQRRGAHSSLSDAHNYMELETIAVASYWIGKEVAYLQGA